MGKKRTCEGAFTLALGCNSTIERYIHCYAVWQTYTKYQTCIYLYFKDILKQMFTYMMGVANFFRIILKCCRFAS